MYVCVLLAVDGGSLHESKSTRQNVAIQVFILCYC